LRDIVNKSLKLNNDLDRYVEQALEQNRPVKIGWGRAGDERPKDGEFGVMTHLPDGARVLCLGSFGDCVGAANRGGTLTIRGDAGSMLGAFQQSGKTVVEKDVGDKAGFSMAGGEISIQGSTGDESGSSMTGGTLLVRGHSGDRLGSGMSGGSIVVMGSVGSEPGIGMTGGRIIISGSCPPPPDGVEMRSIKKSEISEFAKLLDPMGLSLNDDALVLEPGDDTSTRIEKSEDFISEGFENISLYPNEDSLSNNAPLDHYTLLVQDGSDSGGSLLKIPWMISCETTIGSENWEGVDSPAIVRTKTRSCDFLLVGKNEFCEAIDSAGNCSGIVFDISDFPGLNDAEIEAMLISLRSRMSENSIILLRGRIDRIERLFRLVMDLELDGAVVNCATRSGSRLASSLPKIGLAAKAMGIAETGKFVMIEVLHEPDAKDLIVAVASGCTALVSPCPESDLASKISELSVGIRSWMREIGVDRIERIGRRNLRANDFDTAAISGLRLVGYDRPLKMWLDLR
tara:strand:+ start:5857 stop:7398 length:1542 start_codon:yes stop_codon:yes gene_type:complete